MCFGVDSLGCVGCSGIGFALDVLCGIIAYMEKATDQRPVSELTAPELRDALEWRLVQDGIEAADAGRVREVTPAYFDELRDRVRKAANKTQ